MRLKIILATWLLTTQAKALVDMKSASFTNSWTDFKVSETGYSTEISRIYKSRSVYNGLFGFGWCSKYETNLKKINEENIVISECGSGQETSYLKKAGVFKAQSGVSHEQVVLKDNIYTRTRRDASFEKFDLAGHLLQMSDARLNFIKITYTDNLPTRIEDNNFNVYKLSYYDNKKVKEIATTNGLKAQYKYDSDNLISVTITGAGVNAEQKWSYAYDSFHNMTSITSPDKKEIKLKYDTDRDWLLSYTDEDKCVENYRYKNESTKTELKQSSEAIKTCNNKKVSQNKYEISYVKLANGDLAVTRTLTQTRDSTELRTFNAQTGQRLSEKIDDLSINYEYYPDGLLKQKKSQYLKNKFTYTPDKNHIASSLVVQYDAQGKIKAQMLTKAQYDQKGRVQKIENSAGKKVIYTYDDESRFSKITDEKKREFNIRFEEKFNRPVKIQLSTLGEVNIAYKPDGSIDSLKSAKGDENASQILDAYKKTIAIINPVQIENYR